LCLGGLRLTLGRAGIPGVADRLPGSLPLDHRWIVCCWPRPELVQESLLGLSSVVVAWSGLHLGRSAPREREPESVRGSPSCARLMRPTNSLESLRA
jgi:hypothetical protein